MRQKLERAYYQWPMLQRHRRRPYLVGVEDRRKPRVLLRILMVVAAIGIIWYGSGAVMRFFDQSTGRRASTALELRSQDGVQVALQEGDWQAGESGLKLYTGDAVATRSAGDVILRFFDGTKIRLDQNTDVEIISADKQVGGTSKVSVNVRSGRIWISTPSTSVFSGAIVRTVTTTNYSADFTAASSALVAGQILNVLRASGIGAHVTISVDGKPTLIVGEGQYFTMEGNAKSAIEQGQDPYDFRDPVTSQLLKDDFLTSSFIIMNTPDAPLLTVGSGAVIPEIPDGSPLIVSTPENRSEVNAKSITVAGRVGGRVTQLFINGKAITLKPDLSFSADVSLGKESSLAIIVEAQDAQGITLGRIERTVVNAYKVVVEPPRIKSPVGSGETITVRNPVVEVTGEAPPGTAAILVNNYRLQLFKLGDKTWSYLANAEYGNLVVGENRFTVVAVDSEGNRSVPRSSTVIYEPIGGATVSSGSTISSQSNVEPSAPPLKQNPPLQAGTLGVEQPTTGTSADTSGTELSIIGRTSAETYSISVNGYTLSLYTPNSTSWKYIASVELTTMKRGRNVYRIVSRNKNGEILDILEYVINYQP